MYILYINILYYINKRTLEINILQEFFSHIYFNLNNRGITLQPFLQFSEQN